MAHTEKGYLEFTKRLRTLPPCDVLVAGGGIAGCMSAIAAARAGADALLVEGYGFLGGTPIIYGGSDFCFCGDTAAQGGAFDELVAELERLGATVPYEKWDPEAILRFDHAKWDLSVARYFDANAFQIALQEMVRREANLRLLLHTRAVDAVVEDGKIVAAVIHNKSGLQAVRPRVVIDCTGDADLAAAAGFPCVRGREGDGAPLPLSLRVTLRDIGKEVASVLPSWAGECGGGAALPVADLVLNKDRLVNLKASITGFDPVDGDGLTGAEVASRRAIPGIVHRLQTHGYPTCKLDSLATHVGIRMGRRIVGEYVLTVDDLRKGRRFDDAIARGSANLGGFASRDDSSASEERDGAALEVVPAYQIPYRSLIPKGGRGILVAGRCISADSRALSSARMVPTCAMTGQAAGLAAAWCAQSGSSVAEVDVAALQKELRARGAEF